MELWNSIINKKIDYKIVPENHPNETRRVFVDDCHSSRGSKTD
jgi:hypothetical protein